MVRPSSDTRLATSALGKALVVQAFSSRSGQPESLVEGESSSDSQVVDTDLLGDASFSHLQVKPVTKRVSFLESYLVHTLLARLFHKNVLPTAR